MNSNNTQKPEQSNSHITDANHADSQDKHTYRLLGESGLVEDEEGNILDASDLSDPYSLSHQPASGITSEEISARLFTPSKKNKQPDWVAMYDPRYCGPSLEAYVEEMEKKYRESLLNSAPEHSDPSSDGNESASNVDNDISSDTPDSDAQNQVRFHYSKRAVIFYIIGAIFLLFYFVLLIRKLIKEISELF